MKTTFFTAVDVEEWDGTNVPEGEACEPGFGAVEEIGGKYYYFDCFDEDFPQALEDEAVEGSSRPLLAVRVEGVIDDEELYVWVSFSDELKLRIMTGQTLVSDVFAWFSNVFAEINSEYEETCEFHFDQGDLLELVEPWGRATVGTTEANSKVSA